MPTHRLPPFSNVFFTCLITSGIGWIGLILLLFMTVPDLGPHWLFFFLLTLSTTGPALPVAYFLNLRFPNVPPADGVTLIRQALLVGAYFDLLAWLQLGRALTFPLAILIAGGLFLIEYLLRLRSRSRFKPEETGDVSAP